MDRLWPRGVPKTSLEGVSWVKEVAPSSELRSWFGHDPERFADFAARYRTELDERSSEGLTSLLSAVEHGPAPVLGPGEDTQRSPEEMQRVMLGSLNTCHVWAEDGPAVPVIRAGGFFDEPVTMTKRRRELGGG